MIEKLKKHKKRILLLLVNFPIVIGLLMYFNHSLRLALLASLGLIIPFLISTFSGVFKFNTSLKSSILRNFGGMLVITGLYYFFDFIGLTFLIIMLYLFLLEFISELIFLKVSFLED